MTPAITTYSRPYLGDQVSSAGRCSALLTVLGSGMRPPHLLRGPPASSVRGSARGAARRCSLLVVLTRCLPRRCCKQPRSTSSTDARKCDLTAMCSKSSPTAAMLLPPSDGEGRSDGAQQQAGSWRRGGASWAGRRLLALSPPHRGYPLSFRHAATCHGGSATSSPLRAEAALLRRGRRGMSMRSFWK